MNRDKIKHPWVVVDVESDGPIPGKYSMVCFAAVVVEPGLTRSYYGRTAPISDNFIPDALAVSGFTRDEHEDFPLPATTIWDFHRWLCEINGGERVTLVSDNPSYDAMFSAWYLHTYVGKCLFGHSARRINDMWAGLQNNASATQGWKDYRLTKHDHNPLHDATSMAEALLEMKRRGFRIDSVPDQ